MLLKKTQTKLFFQSTLDVLFAILLGNLLALPFLLWAIPRLSATNEIRIEISKLPGDDKLLSDWYEAKAIEHVEIIREESTLKIIYPGTLTDDWQIPNSLELEAMGYSAPGKFDFYKKPYSDMISGSDKEKAISAIFNNFPVEVGRLIFILILASQSGFLIIGWWRRRPLLKNDEAWQNERMPAAKAILLGVLTGLLLFTFGTVYEQFVKSVFGDSVVSTISTLGMWETVRSVGAIEKMGIILLGSLFAPFCEELFFRGLFFRRFLQTGFPLLGLILSSLVFASMHFDFINIFAYFIFGLILGLLYWKTKSLTASVLAHGINNALALMVLIFL